MCLCMSSCMPVPISAAEFRSYFERYGRVVSSEVMFNRETHKSRGFGFVVFEQEYSAVKVCATDEHCIDGKVVSNDNEY
jgi:RNA-binding protein Musashi